MMRGPFNQLNVAEWGWSRQWIILGLRELFCVKCGVGEPSTESGPHRLGKVAISRLNRVERLLSPPTPTCINPLSLLSFFFFFSVQWGWSHLSWHLPSISGYWVLGERCYTHGSNNFSLLRIYLWRHCLGAPTTPFNSELHLWYV